MKVLARPVSVLYAQRVDKGTMVTHKENALSGPLLLPFGALFTASTTTINLIIKIDRVS